jgi:hypothetical protein
MGIKVAHLLLVLDIGIGCCGVVCQHDLELPDPSAQGLGPAGGFERKIAKPFGSSVAWVRQLTTRTVSNCP